MKMVLVSSAILGNASLKKGSERDKEKGVEDDPRGNQVSIAGIENSMCGIFR